MRKGQWCSTEITARVRELVCHITGDLDVAETSTEEGDLTTFVG